MIFDVGTNQETQSVRTISILLLPNEHTPLREVTHCQSGWYIQK